MMTSDTRLNSWARRARGTWTARARLRAIARLARVAERCRNTRRHYAVTVRAWRAIDAHEVMLVKQMVRAVLRCETTYYRFPLYALEWQTSLCGARLTSRGAGVSEIAAGDPAVERSLRRVIDHVTRELVAPIRR